MDNDIQVVGDLTNSQMLNLVNLSKPTRCKLHVFRNKRDIEDNLDPSVPVLLVDLNLFPVIESGPVLRNGLMPALPGCPISQTEFNGFVICGRNHQYIQQASSHFEHLNDQQLKPIYQYAVNHSLPWSDRDLGLAIVRKNYDAIKLYFEYFEQNPYSLLASHHQLLFTHLSEQLEDKSDDYQIMVDILKEATSTPNRDRDRNLLASITSSLSLLRKAMDSYERPLRDFPPASIAISSPKEGAKAFVRPIRADFPLETAFSQLNIPDVDIPYINDHDTVFTLSACGLEAEFTSLKALVNSCVEAVQVGAKRELSNSYVIDSVPVCVLMQHIQTAKSTASKDAAESPQQDRTLCLHQ